MEHGFIKAGKTKQFWSDRTLLIHRKEEQTKTGLTNVVFFQISLHLLSVNFKDSFLRFTVQFRRVENNAG